MKNRLARSAGTVGLATLTSRVLGLVRDVVQGYYFGTGLAADAFGVATRIPTLLRDLFAEGAMSAAFVPTFTRHLEKRGRGEAFRLGAQVLNGLLILTGILVFAGILLADPLVRAYTEFTDPEKIRLTVLLAQVNMPFLTLIAVAAALMGMLNGLRHFFVPAMSPALLNVCFIACTAILTPIFTRHGIEPAMALSIGMLTGGVAQILVQVPTLWRLGSRHQWVLDAKDPGVREVLMLMGPGSIGVAAAQVNLFVNTILATSQDGAVSSLQYAFRMIYMPIGIIGVSVATAAIPEIARRASEADIAGMRATLSWGMRLMLMLSVPATVGLMVLATPIIELIYQRGAFTSVSTGMVAAALLFYAPGIVGYSVVKIVSPCFYSMQDARTPITVSLITIAVNLVLNIVLNAWMGFTGLALGTAVASIFNAGLLLVMLSRKIDGIDAARIWWSFGKIALASAAMGLAAWGGEAWLRDLLPGDGLTVRAVRVFSAIGGSMAVLAVSAWALRIDEFNQALGRIRAKLGR
ncbi:MAG: murein biosynthesis integral membrane protein MurJ [Acidobacteria bacterium]|nr:murein biosynthesis integral membrane protein MurJ [Acidobacteriota bacterium]